MARRYVGIDLAKRTMEVCILEGKKIRWHGLTTDEKGRQTLVQLLRKSDEVGYEVCSYGNRLARTLQNEVGCQVTSLNAGELRIIWKSRKKTDREDSLKIAKYPGNGSSLGHTGGRAVRGTATEGGRRSVPF